MQVYFRNHRSKIAAKRSSKFQRMAIAAGEFYTGSMHTICVTPVLLNGQISSGYGSGYKPLETFTDPPSVQLLDESVIKMEGGGSLKAVVAPNLNPQWIKRVFDEPQDWYSFAYLYLWWMASSASSSIYLYVYDSQENFCLYLFHTDPVPDTWKEIAFDLNDPIISGGNMNWHEVKRVEFTGLLSPSTHYLDDLRGDDTQILSLDLDAANWKADQQSLGPYCVPSVAATDSGVLVAAWIKKGTESYYLRVARQGDSDAWNTDWSSPATIHIASEISGICCLPQHGDADGIDIYFQAKTGNDWVLYRAWTDASGNYVQTEQVALTSENWTASVLSDGTKAILLAASDPNESNAFKTYYEQDGSWQGPLGLQTYIRRLVEGEYQWILWENVLIEDYPLISLWDKINGGGSDINKKIHVTSSALREGEGGNEKTQDIYFLIDIAQGVARGEFLFEEMGVPWDPRIEEEEALSVEFLTGIPHVFFEGEGSEYNVVYHGKKQSGFWTYDMFYNGTREYLGASTRDDNGGAIALVGEHWENLDDELLRASILTVTSSIAPEKDPFRQSQNDNSAGFIATVKDSENNAWETDESYSRVKTPSLAATQFQNPYPFPLPRQAIYYSLNWLPSIKIEQYAFWVGKQNLTFRYLLPDLHIHSLQLDHETLDGKVTVISAEIHNEATTEEDTDDAPGEFLCRFYLNNPDPDADGIVTDPLPPGCEQLGEDVYVQGLQAGDTTQIRTETDFEGDPRSLAIYVAIDVDNDQNEKEIYENGQLLDETEKNNVYGSSFLLKGVLILHVGHDKMVYIEPDTAVKFNAAATDAFLIPQEGCNLTGLVRIPFKSITRNMESFQDLSGGNYSSQYIFQEEDPYGFYAYVVSASKQNYLPATQQSGFIRGKRFSGQITVLPTPEVDSVNKKDLITLREKFAGVNGPLLVTQVTKRNLDAITFQIEEPDENLAEVIESLSEE